MIPANINAASARQKMIDKNMAAPYTTLTYDGSSVVGLSFPDGGSQDDYLKSIDSPELLSVFGSECLGSYFSNHQAVETQIESSGIQTANYEHLQQAFDFDKSIIVNNEGSTLFSPMTGVINGAELGLVQLSFSEINDHMYATIDYSQSEQFCDLLRHGGLFNLYLEVPTLSMYTYTPIPTFTSGSFTSSGVTYYTLYKSWPTAMITDLPYYSFYPTLSYASAINTRSEYGLYDWMYYYDNHGSLQADFCTLLPSTQPINYISGKYIIPGTSNISCTGRGSGTIKNFNGSVFSNVSFYTCTYYDTSSGVLTYKYLSRTGATHWWHLGLTYFPDLDLTSSAFSLTYTAPFYIDGSYTYIMNSIPTAAPTSRSLISNITMSLSYQIFSQRLAWIKFDVNIPGAFSNISYYGSTISLYGCYAPSQLLFQHIPTFN